MCRSNFKWPDSEVREIRDAVLHDSRDLRFTHGDPSWWWWKEGELKLGDLFGDWWALKCNITLLQQWEWKIFMFNVALMQQYIIICDKISIISLSFFTKQTCESQKCCSVTALLLFLKCLVWLWKSLLMGVVQLLTSLTFLLVVRLLECHCPRQH